MRVSVFLEGSPGHEKQTRAILEALEKLTQLESHVIKLKRIPRWQRLQQLARFLLFPDGGCQYDVQGSDVVIGTGSLTHVPMLACKKKFGTVAVTCMAPEKLLMPRFDLCFVPRHDGLAGSETVFLTEGPPVLQPPPLAREESRGLILIGGADEKNHSWNEELLIEQLAGIAGSMDGISWIVSSSPRTPESTVDKIVSLADEATSLRFYHYRNTPPGWVEEQYARSRYVWVTGDSMSMIYEAITAGCSVGILPIEYRKAENKFKRSIDHLLAQEMIVIYGHNNSKMGVNVKPLKEAERCARELLVRYG